MEEFHSLNLVLPGTHECFIDPTVAKEILDTYNWKNRGKKETKIESYTRDMKYGRWVFNGDPLRFSVNEDEERKGEAYLSDGQNRLYAQVNSSTRQRWVIVTGLEDVAQETMDRGAGRTPGDMAKLRGIPNATSVMAICGRAWLFEDQHRVASGRVAGSLGELFAYYEADPERIQAAARKYNVTQPGIPVNPSVAMTCFYLASKVNQKDAESFFIDKLMHNIGLELNDPANALKLRLSNLSLATGGRKVDPSEAFRYIVVAWNHFRRGNKVTKIQKPREGWKDELLRFL